MTSTPSEPDPDSPKTTVSGPRRRRSLRARTWVLVGAGAALAMGGAAVAALALAEESARQEAVAAVESAEGRLQAATERRVTAQVERQTAETSLQELSVTCAALAEVSGVGIDQAASESLVSTCAAVTPPEEPDPTSATPATIDVETATRDELIGHAKELSSAATRMQEAATAEESLVEGLHADITVLSTAFSDYARATAAAGSAVILDRDDASEETRQSLQEFLDALSSASPVELPSTVESYRDAVDAVIASSDAARAPRGSGRIGTGVDDPTSLTVVVNKRRPLPSGYAPDDLRTPSGIGGALPLRAVAAAAAERMAAAMADEGITLRMSSGYRSFSRQTTIYNGFVAREGVAGADEHSARPGYSEHQTGFAADFDDGTGCKLNVCFANAAGGIWLAENAWEYGFILRYGEGWQPTVGYRFEPWHYRYVGETVAADMHARGITTLEDYFALGDAPDYG